MTSEAATEFTVPKLTRATQVWRACVLAAAAGVIQLATASPAAAVPGLYLVTSPPSVWDSSPTKTATAYCRPGDRVIGGGWVDNFNANKVRLIALRPTKSATGDSFAATGDEPSPGFDGAWKVTAAAGCALDSSVPGHEIAYSPYVLSSATFQSRAAGCPSGKRVLGTGALVLGGDHHVCALLIATARRGLKTFGSAVLGAAALVAVSHAQEPSKRALEIHSEQLKWMPNTPTPPGGLVAVLLGRPVDAGRYIVRLKFPPNYRVMPHTHPDDRFYTVLEGVFQIGIGERYDESALKKFRAGSLWVVPAKTPHFHRVDASGTIVQVDGSGPTATDYVNPAHDPRSKHR